MATVPAEAMAEVCWHAEIAHRETVADGGGLLRKRKGRKREKVRGTEGGVIYTLRDVLGSVESDAASANTNIRTKTSEEESRGRNNDALLFRQTLWFVVEA